MCLPTVRIRNGRTDYSDMDAWSIILVSPSSQRRPLLPRAASPSRRCCSTRAWKSPCQCPTLPLAANGKTHIQCLGVTVPMPFANLGIYGDHERTCQHPSLRIEGSRESRDPGIRTSVLRLGVSGIRQDCFSSSTQRGHHVAPRMPLPHARHYYCSKERRRNLGT